MSKHEKRNSVFLLIRSLNIGGAERQLVYLAVGLRKIGVDVTVGVFYKGGVLEADLLREGVRLVHIGKSGRYDIIGFGFRLVSQIRKARPELLYCFLGTSNILGAISRPFLPPMRLVWSVRASDVDLARYDWLARASYLVERALSNLADLIISNSAAGVAHAVANGYPRKKLRVVHNGIDTDRFKPDREARLRVREEWRVGEGETLIGVLARFDPMKDHPNFLRAASAVATRRAEVRFVCIGDGPHTYRAQLANLADELGIAERMIWPGPSTMPADSINGLDVYCSSSAFGEGFSNSIAEAMACGVPCVVTDVGDSALIVGDTGRVVARCDSDALATALMTSLEELAGDAGLRARHRIVENFSVEQMVKTTADLFDTR